MATTTDYRLIEDLALDRVSGDLVIDDEGRFVGLPGTDRIAQRIQLRLGIQAGEWFLDIALGVDWLGQILVKPTSLRVARALIGQALLSVPEVIQINELDVDDDPTTRQLTVGFTVQTTAGPITQEVTTP